MIPRRTLSLVLSLGLALSLTVPALAAPPQFLREQRSVTLGGRTETWQLVWQGRPKRICGPEDVETAITCPCTGFAYGEIGQLALVRKRGGAQVERMDLGPLFADLPFSPSDGLAAMQWRPLQAGDFDAAADGSSPRFLAAVAKRAGPRVMQLADYDKDGVASEFLIQVSAGPCGHTDYAAVGISTANPRLHALSSAEKPGEPLIMPGRAWAALLGGKGVVTSWPCGDHGADRQSDLVLSAQGGRISVRQRALSCPDDGSAGTVLEEAPY